MTTPSAVLPAAVASVSEVRNQVAEALRRLDELVGASPPGEPSSSAIILLAKHRRALQVVHHRRLEDARLLRLAYNY